MAIYKSVEISNVLENCKKWDCENWTFNRDNVSFLDGVACYMCGEESSGDQYVYNILASHLCNLAESKEIDNRDGFIGLFGLSNFWYSPSSYDNGKNASNEKKAMAKQALTDCLVNGKRYMPRYVDNFDGFGETYSKEWNNTLLTVGGDKENPPTVPNTRSKADAIAMIDGAIMHQSYVKGSFGGHGIYFMYIGDHQSEGNVFYCESETLWNKYYENDSKYFTFKFANGSTIPGTGNGGSSGNGNGGDYVISPTDYYWYGFDVKNIERIQWFAPQKNSNGKYLNTLQIAMSRAIWNFRHPDIILPAENPDGLSPVWSKNSDNEVSPLASLAPTSCPGMGFHKYTTVLASKGANALDWIGSTTRKYLVENGVATTDNSESKARLALAIKADKNGQNTTDVAVFLIKQDRALEGKGTRADIAKGIKEKGFNYAIDLASGDSTSLIGPSWSYLPNTYYIRGTICIWLKSDSRFYGTESGTIKKHIGDKNSVQQKNFKTDTISKIEFLPNLNSPYTGESMEDTINNIDVPYGFQRIPDVLCTAGPLKTSPVGEVIQFGGVYSEKYSINNMGGEKREGVAFVDGVKPTFSTANDVKAPTWFETSSYILKNGNYAFNIPPYYVNNNVLSSYNGIRKPVEIPDGSGYFTGVTFDTSQIKNSKINGPWIDDTIKNYLEKSPRKESLYGFSKAKEDSSAMVGTITAEQWRQDNKWRIPYEYQPQDPYNNNGLAGIYNNNGLSHACNLYMISYIASCFTQTWINVVEMGDAFIAKGYATGNYFSEKQAGEILKTLNIGFSFFDGSNGLSVPVSIDKKKDNYKTTFINALEKNCILGLRVNNTPCDNNHEWASQEHWMCIIDYKKEDGIDKFKTISFTRPSNDDCWIIWEEIDKCIIRYNIAYKDGFSFSDDSSK